jgi:hypothetical protein
MLISNAFANRAPFAITRPKRYSNPLLECPKTTSNCEAMQTAPSESDDPSINFIYKKQFTALPSIQHRQSTSTTLSTIKSPKHTPSLNKLTWYPKAITVTQKICNLENIFSKLSITIHRNKLKTLRKNSINCLTREAISRNYFERYYWKRIDNYIYDQ